MFKIRIMIKMIILKLFKKAENKKEIIDITGIKLTPGNYGKNCKGNGEHRDWRGRVIECCCDECDYYMCCYEMQNDDECVTCANSDCPKNKIF